jgi:hypothetical protein
VALVWANWRYSLDEALPIFVHEISHAVDGILEHTGVEDTSGVARSYFIEKETARILEKIYHRPVAKRLASFVERKLSDWSGKSPRDNEASMSDKSEEGVVHQETGTPIVFVGEDEMYNYAIVYIYGSFELYRETCTRLFNQKEVETSNEKGNSTIGMIKSPKNEFCVTIWANWRYSLDEALQIFIREISYAVNDILQHAEVEDKNGEARAYFIERETDRILEGMYHKPVIKHPANVVQEVLCDILTKNTHANQAQR